MSRAKVLERVCINRVEVDSQRLESYVEWVPIGKPENVHISTAAGANCGMSYIFLHRFTCRNFLLK
jgi:hypothetical protein